MSTAAPAASKCPTDVDLQSMFSATFGALATEVASDIQEGGRAHMRFLNMLDLVYLDNFVSEQDPTAGRAGDLNTMSHVPYPQPWSPATRAPGT